jgi:hypothetical protein
MIVWMIKRMIKQVRQLDDRNGVEHKRLWTELYAELVHSVEARFRCTAWYGFERPALDHS